MKKTFEFYLLHRSLDPYMITGIQRSDKNIGHKVLVPKKSMVKYANSGL